MTTRAAISILLLVLVGCMPKLQPPGEAKRFSGRVKGRPKTPVQIRVYEQCSPRFYVFERCPGRLVGEAKIAKPGPFIVEADPQTAIVSVFAFRGDPGSESQCAGTDVAVSDAKPLFLKLAEGPCRVPLPVR